MLKKNQLLAIDPSHRRNCKTFINIEGNDGNSEQLVSGTELKILGFYFGENPGASKHVYHLKRKFWARAWVLRHLKRQTFHRVT